MPNKLSSWLVLALSAGVVTGCEAAAEHPTLDDDAAENDYPPVNAGDKYFKPGPVLATPDTKELSLRFDYHQKVIDTHQLSYMIRENAAMHMELSDITGLKIPEDSGNAKPKTQKSYQTVSLPAVWDGRAQGVGMPPIRNQGQCGSCWAFGTTAAVEAAIAVFDKKIVNLSEQQVLDCSGQGTCGGGFWAYNVFLKQGGALEASYPYTAYDGNCKGNVDHPYKIESYHAVPDHDIVALKAAIHQYGAVGVTMAVCGSFPGYGGGVYDSNECNFVGSNHIVALVGWDDTVQHKKGKGVWIVRNSWGEGWGDKGYAYMAYGTAGIEENGTYVVYKAEDPTDSDGDGVTDLHDNCKADPNPDQVDEDEDGQGNACDAAFNAFEKALTLSDDDSRKVELGFTFPFYGTTYTSVNVNSDGNLTFGTADGQAADRSKSRFLTLAPRIAALYADLNPAQGGKVTYGKSNPTTLFVKYDGVPLYGASGGNTVTVTLDVSGKITIAAGAVSAASYIVGVSRGGQGNTATGRDLSAAGGQIAMNGTNAVFEEFAKGAFDLTGKAIVFAGDNDNDPDPGPGPGPDAKTESTLALGDDATQKVALGFSFPFFGKTYTDVYVNSDGNLTFGSGDSETTERSAARFLAGVPRIGVLYGDLDPSANGTVTVRHDDDQTVTIKYNGIPLWGAGGAGSTAAVTLNSTGLVRIAYGAVNGSSYVAGVSAGGPGNSAVETDLSAAGGQISYSDRTAVYEVYAKPKVFDLANKTLSFTTEGTVDPGPGPGPDAPSETSIALADDATASVTLGFSFPFFGKSYTKVYVNSDGNLTFGVGDGATADRSVARFLTGAPRIAAVFADLDPSSGGGVSYHQNGAGSVTISYTGVPVWGGGGTSTVSITLEANGTITMAADDIGAASFIVGVSKGGAGNDAAESDLAGSGDVVHYSGDGAVYEVFSSASYVFEGKKLVFAP